MLDEKMRAELDQSMAALNEICPKLWYGLFRKCVEEGFTEDQAMEIVKVMVSNGTKGNI